MAALGAAALLPRALSARTDALASDDRVLVLVQLAGGNDGLSMVVPYGDDAYHRARNRTRIGAKDVLRIDEYRGLHPSLGRLHERFRNGGLAVVEGVGYPNPNRSHFKSFEIWHTADPRGRASGEGWIGRLCEKEFGDDARPNRVVHVGAKMPYSVFSTSHPAAAFTMPAGYRWVHAGEELDEVNERANGAAPEEHGEWNGDALAYVRARMRDARASSAALRIATMRYRTPVDYGSDAFDVALRDAAAIASSGVGARVLSVTLDGFDTHRDQRSSHDALMRTLDRGLASFLDDLERSELGRRAVVLVFSEFGRRVEENASFGTDHGCAGPMFVAGGAIRGGLFGAPPSLSELTDGGDLAFTTDFRSVYAEAIEACFDVPPSAVLGAEFPSLGLRA